jgi:hypothetical protein
MIAAPSDYVSIAIHDPRSKSQRKDSVQETAAIAHDFIRKFGRPSRSQVIEALIGFGFSDLEANQGLRHLEDNHEIFLIEDSGLLKILFYSNVLSSEFERQQKQLQDDWLRAREEEGA